MAATIHRSRAAAAQKMLSTNYTMHQLKLTFNFQCIKIGNIEELIHDSAFKVRGKMLQNFGQNARFCKTWMKRNIINKLCQQISKKRSFAKATCIKRTIYAKAI